MRKKPMVKSGWEKELIPDWDLASNPSTHPGVLCQILSNPKSSADLIRCVLRNPNLPLETLQEYVDSNGYRHAVLHNPFCTADMIRHIGSRDPSNWYYITTLKNTPEDVLVYLFQSMAYQFEAFRVVQREDLPYGIWGRCSWPLNSHLGIRALP